MIVFNLLGSLRRTIIVNNQTEGVMVQEGREVIITKIHHHDFYDQHNHHLHHHHHIHHYYRHHNQTEGVMVQEGREVIPSYRHIS